MVTIVDGFKRWLPGWLSRCCHHSWQSGLFSRWIVFRVLFKVVVFEVVFEVVKVVVKMDCF